MVLVRVAIVGTRKCTPGSDLYEMLSQWSHLLLTKGVEVSTGAADGADDAAMEGAKMLDKEHVHLRRNLHVFLPWATYNRNRVPTGSTVTVYNERVHAAWLASVWKYHPAPAALTRGPLALHGRNYGIVADPFPVDAVIALPTTLSSEGGTGQAMRIARDLGIKMFNLRQDGQVTAAAQWIDAL